tara:strand:- start:552 stop:752 length:201 start_codon:yes stop_codon:yes gene_type:complete
MSDYSSNYSTGWYSVSPSFAWWCRPVPNVDTIKQSQETERVAQKNKREEKDAKYRVDGEATISVYA